MPLPGPVNLMYICCLCLTFAQLLATAHADFVCYHDEGCADNDTRPIFVLGSSASECCGKPSVVAARDITTENCQDCGPPRLMQLTPQFVVLFPPNQVVLEISATGYTAITWLVNGTDMHDFERIVLENFSMRFILVDTMESDTGVYEADVHTVFGNVNMATFYVDTFSPPTVTVSNTPGSFTLYCNTTGFPPPTVVWQDRTGANVTSALPNGNLSQSIFSVRTLTLELEPTSEPLEFICLATTLYNGQVWTANGRIYINTGPPILTFDSGPVVNVTEGLSVGLSCSAQGHPTPSFRWIYNAAEIRVNEGIHIENSTEADTVSSVLMIENVSYSKHHGTYVCLATNSVGQDFTLIELDVKFPPKVTALPEQRMVYSQQEPVFVCAAVGNSIPQLHWERNGQIIDEMCSRCSDMGEACEDGEIGEAGELGEAGEMGEAELGEAGEFGEAGEIGEAGETEMDIMMGDSLDMNGIDFEDPSDICMITIYQTNENSIVSELTILDLSYFKDEEDNVTVRVFTCYGENGVQNLIDSPESASVELIILDGPYFIRGLPHTTRATLINSFQLECIAEGTASQPQITWYKDSEVLTPDKNRTRIDNYNESSKVVQSVLTFLSVLLSDAAVYRCEAVDNDGINSMETILKVLVPANITRFPEPAYADPGGMAVFTCGTQGFDQPMVFWERVGGIGEPQSLTNDGKFVITELESNATAGTLLSQLEVRNVTDDDFGVYTCNVTNMVDIPSGLIHDIIQSASAELIQQRAPQFEVIPRDKTETVNRTIQFVCIATGVPTPHLMWYREGEMLNMSSRIDFQFNELESHATLSLNILNTMPSDSGLYSCVAGNRAGIAESSFQLTINFPPNITTFVAHTATFPTTFITSLCCASTGSPAPVITWFRGTNPILCGEENPVIIEDIIPPPPYTTLHDRCVVIPSSGMSELVVVNPRVEDEGIYMCMAQNSEGATTALVDLYVEVEPVAVVDLVSERVSELEPFSLHCLTLHLPTPQVSWLKDNELLLTDTSLRTSVTTSTIAEYHLVSILTVDRAEPGGDDGIYQCRIDNTQGSSVVFDSFSITVQVRDDCALEQGSPCQNDGECIDELGGYYCICTTNYSGTNCTELVDNSEGPIIFNDPEDIEAVLLEMIHIDCEAQGNPKPVYSWYKDDVFLRNTSEPFYPLEEVKPGDRGFYHCIATNSIASSNRSRSGLLSIDGIYQYSATFTCAEEYDYADLVMEMSLCVSENTIVGGLAEVLSITERPIQPPSPQLSEQIVITVVGNGTTSQQILQDLGGQLDILSTKFGCDFTDLRRFDGCPEEQTLLNENYNVYVTWPESEIGTEPVKTSCPCGDLNANRYGHPNLTRVCGGSYTYGAEWEEMDASGCNFTDHTYRLCSLTMLDEVEQAIELASVTGNASEFHFLDFAIAGLIMQNLAEAGNITSNAMFQSNFTRSFSNLLNIGRAVVRESQELFQTASNILDTLNVFGRRLRFENASSTNITLQEPNFQVQVQDVRPEMQHTYSPDLASSGSLADIQDSPMDTPLEGATTSLTSELLHLLGSTHSTDTLRILNVLLQSDAFFVTAQPKEELGLVVGNLIIAASIFNRDSSIIKRQSLMVEDLAESQSVTIKFNFTKGINGTCITPMCVFWDDDDESSPYGNWSEQGCKLVGIEGSEVTCICDHLTHFGLLMDISPDERESAETLTLQTITYIGSIVSITLLTILLLTYVTSRKLRSKVPGKMLIHSCIALIGIYISFLLAIHGEEYTEAFCYVVSAVLQYFLLAYFLWTAVEAFHICFKLIKVFGADIRNYVFISSLIAWGLPLLIVGLSAGFGVEFNMYKVAKEDKVENDLLCSTKEAIIMCRADEIVFYVGILAPFVITYTFNIIVYFIIIGSLSWQVLKKTKDEVKREMLHEEYKRLAVVAFFLAIMFGLAWIFAILVVIPDTTVSIISQYLFSFFVGFQGLLYFIMHGIRSPDARKFWITLVYKPCPSKMPTFLKTWTTTSPYHNTKPVIPRSKQNPLYASQDNLLSSPGESTFNTLQRQTDTTMMASHSSYSLASQMVQIDFTLPTIISDDEASSMDMQELTDIINTKFSDPKAPGVAVSPPRMPISSAHEHSPLTKQSFREPTVDKEFRLHVETNEALDLAYDSVTNIGFDSSEEEK